MYTCSEPVLELQHYSSPYIRSMSNDALLLVEMRATGFRIKLCRFRYATYERFGLSPMDVQGWISGEKAIDFGTASLSCQCDRKFLYITVCDKWTHCFDLDSVNQRLSVGPAAYVS